MLLELSIHLHFTFPSPHFLFFLFRINICSVYNLWYINTFPFPFRLWSVFSYFRFQIVCCFFLANKFLSFLCLIKKKCIVCFFFFLLLDKDKHNLLLLIFLQGVFVEFIKLYNYYHSLTLLLLLTSLPLPHPPRIIGLFTFPFRIQMFQQLDTVIWAALLLVSSHFFLFKIGSEWVSVWVSWESDWVSLEVRRFA